MERPRRYNLDTLPYNENLEPFAPPYNPEEFTEREQEYLRPFFTNTDEPVFVIHNLPEEVIAALSSRYSRSVHSLRRTFLTEYVTPVIFPETQPGWEKLNSDEKDDRLQTREAFLNWVDFLNTHGGIDKAVNIQRARGFFSRWLAEYSDDSIAEMGGVHLCIEGLSNLTTKEIEDKRIGMSPLEKSSRYVSFGQRRPDGNYQYIVPGEIKGTEHELAFKRVMDNLFAVYDGLQEPYLAYIKELYPKGEDETNGSFNSSRSAKRYDDIRDLLPFATQTNVALYGNGRAYEDLVNRLMDHPLGELRYWGKMMCRELAKVVPSFVERPRTERGAKMQVYRSNVESLRTDIARELFEGTVWPHNSLTRPRGWVRLVSHTPDPDVEILATFIAPRSGVALSRVRQQVVYMGKKEREDYLDKILAERKMGADEVKRDEARFRKPHRAFENAHFLYEFWARGGDYRDLQRHRTLTQDRQLFTTCWGYDLEKEVLDSPFFAKNGIKAVLQEAGILFKGLEGVSPYIAQYAVPFAFIQNWYMNLSAREIYWMSELRTGSQGRPHYRKIVQRVATIAQRTSKSVFGAMMVDWNDYSLARRESELRTARKITDLDEKRQLR